MSLMTTAAITFILEFRFEATKFMQMPAAISFAAHRDENLPL